MGIKDWFGSKEPAPPPEIDDLIVLERWEEAEDRLRTKIKLNQRDTRSQTKLAEVYLGMGQAAKAVDQYIVVADQWAVEGFHDRSIALLYKAMKLNPDDETRSKLYRKIERFKQAKLLSASRTAAIDGLKSRERQGDSNATLAALEVERLWHKLERSSLLRDLDAPTLKRLFAGMELIHLDPGELLADVGTTDERLFLIVDGVIEVITLSASGPIRSFGGGDLVGDRALFEHRPWAASYRAAERTTLLTLDRAGLEAAMLGNPDPRGFLNALRSQQGDAEVVKILVGLGATVS